MSDCSTNTNTIGAPTASGTNSTCMSAPTIIQYPRPPRNDLGIWQAVGSIVGTFVGRLANADLISDAKDAERTWRELNDRLRDNGIQEWGRSDYEYDYAKKLEECNDSLHEKLCAFVECGYNADYQGILIRARADAMLETDLAIAKANRAARRYNSGINADVVCDLRRNQVIATVTAATLAREQERQNSWRYRGDLLMKVTDMFENHRSNRIVKHLALEEMGANEATGAGENYQFLAESLRRTAQKDIGGTATFIASMASIIYGLTQAWKDNDGEQSCKPATA